MGYSFDCRVHPKREPGKDWHVPRPATTVMCFKSLRAVADTPMCPHLAAAFTSQVRR